MDNLPTPSSAILRDRGFSASHGGNHSTPARHGVERAGSRNGANARRPEEGRSPSNLPKAFESMLKTTTETGDIGMFSIKPSRVPPPVNSPRRMGPYNENGPVKQQHHHQQQYQSFQPYGVPAVDDRRRLPSYARDTTSELISMYESPSQKSSRVFDDNTDYRSYSMTHTTAYSLTNHRSYTSLRSQPDGGAILQRPRSPFAYPTRLRRPGFRPSSPALTDGGAVDYRRRAEIDRQPYGPGHSTSSPSSLYAHKRMPPMLRPEGNRSTPSLLSQPSPPRRCSSPLAVHSGNTSHDWARRMGPTSVNTSPARSTFSLASTANHFVNNLPPSNTTTPGKLQSQTPMYYDYTEEFDETYSQSAGREPPPQFRMAETIPEDRPMNAGRPSLVDANARSVTPNLKNGVRVSSSSASIHQVPTQDNSEPNIHDSYNVWVAPEPVVATPGVGHTSSESSWNGQKTPELNDEALDSGRRADISFGLARKESIARRCQMEQVSTTNLQYGQSQSTDGLQPARQKIKLDLSIRQTSNNPNSQEQTGQEILTTPQRSKKVIYASFSPASASKKMKCDPKRSSSLDFDMGRKRVRSSGFNSIDTGITDLADLLSSLDSANETQHSDDTENPTLPPERVRMNSPTIPEEIVKKTEVLEHTPLLPLSTFNSHSKQREGDPSIIQPSRYRRQRPQHIEPATIQKAGDFKDLSFDFPRKSVSRSGSPMLAPKPISPARQLKLKNSVPQLMKALPPLPPHLLRLCDSPSNDTALDENTPPQDIVVANFPSTSRIIQPPPKVFQPNGTQGTGVSETLVEIPENNEVSLTTNSLDRKTVNDETAPIASPPKLKLKLRSSAAATKVSPHDSRPWNSEENYPWSEQNPNIRLPSMITKDKPSDSKPARFKLKSSRASNSLSDTVKITRDIPDSKTAAGLHLPHAKDLFTAPLAVDNLFHQLGKHLHSRRSSATSSQPETESSQAAGSSAHTVQRSTGQASRLADEPLTPVISQSGCAEDSSDEHAHHSLRKKFTNLKARLTAPYLLRGGSHSYDDVTLRAMRTGNSTIPPAIRSVPNLHASIGLSVEVEDTTLRTERVKRVRLKDKLSKWLKGAKMAISARVRSLSSSG
ncbi:hypothetical protein GLAREA_00790 [Glarea lozoyensis ATCC 20868]|uniref:Uncharacterized protein n=1 Tax=Glarea lozoyensis (strain ATCC 20868 / MF5171) TaxID=1116229 RepID=S3CVE2_GLAL2|nr:uncharacterized protein GLAREA_00790 [Glarea lozoyensis ATCC 20868]EPE29630.1 hypothetical protein GLAREA_00790 [Glarea lozoyensis ATCC 20868]